MLITGLVFTGANLWVFTAFEVEQYPIPLQVGFDDYIRTDYRDIIEEEKPEIIILGDSAIRKIDERAFSNTIGKKTMLFSVPGSASAYWYLFIRNVIRAASHQPDYLFLFFRETTLTLPHYLVTGDYFTRLDEVASPADADVYHLAVNSRKSRFEILSEIYLPLFTYRSTLYLNTINWFRNLIPSWLFDLDADEVNAAYDAVFDDEHINDLLWEEFQLNVGEVLYQPEALEFENQVEVSFLPAMIRELKRMGIKPVFIRVRYRSHAEGKSDDEELVGYLETLAGYLESQGAVMVNMASTTGLTTNMYIDNFHLDEKYAPEFSRVMAEEIIRYID